MSMHIKIKKNKFYYDDYKVKCAVGKRGISIKRKEGDNITPIGSFKIKYVLFRKDRILNIKTNLKKIPIKKNMGWCNEPNSQYYNKLISFPFFHSAEKLYLKNNIYDVIIVINFNMNPIIKNKGSAIFLHIAKKNYKKTAGCVAISKKDMKKVLSKINSKTKINIY